MKVLFTSLFTLLTVISFSQKVEDDLKPFNKLIVDPHIDVELRKGDREKIEVFYNNIDPQDIYAEHSGNTLHVYLKDAKIGWNLLKNDNFNDHKYSNTTVRMVITYVELNNIQFRGEERLICNDELTTMRLKIRVFGETEVRLTSIDAAKFKLALYGENELTISGGQVDNQIINTYGENRVDVRNLTSYGIRTTNFGENKLQINATDYLKATYFGEGELYYTGNPIIERKWLLGEVDVRNIR